MMSLISECVCPQKWGKGMRNHSMEDGWRIYERHEGELVTEETHTVCTESRLVCKCASLAIVTPLLR